MSNEAKTSIVTGACGFIGSHLSKALLDRGHRVIAVDNLSTGSQHNLNWLKKQSGELELIQADVTKPWDFLKSQDIDKIFHFASPASPPAYQKLGLETLWVNTLGLEKALEAADQNSARVIFASTSEVYGDPTVTPQKESYLGNVNCFGPRACYDEAKRFGEALLYTHNQRYGTPHGLIRIFNTYGPHMSPKDGRVVTNFLVQALLNEPLTIYGNGHQTRSFCYIDDLIEGILAYAFSDCKTPVNFGNPKEFTVKELAEKVKELLPESKSQIVYQEEVEDDPKIRCPDISFAQEKFGWKPKVELEAGLKKTLSWLRTQVEL
jgi:nucleoside-diphosphate-sugar epimerase